MGQSVQRYHAQEYRFEERGGGLDPSFHQVGEHFQELEEGQCEPYGSWGLFPCTCCNVEEMEEAVVVHHDALRQLNFLMSYDELAQEDLPAVPRCISEVRQAKARTQLARRQCSPRPDAKRLAKAPFHVVRGASGGGGSAASSHVLQPPDIDASPEAQAHSDARAPPEEGEGDFLQTLDELEIERRCLASFLRRMMRGIRLRMLVDPGGGARDAVLRLVIGLNKNVFRVEAEDVVEVLPLETIRNVHIGPVENGAELPTKVQDGGLGMVMTLDRRGSRPDLGSAEVSFSFTFLSEDDREWFRRGMVRLREFLQNAEPEVDEEDGSTRLAL